MIIKNKDLFDSGVFVDLHESEMESINGGQGLSGEACSPRGRIYTEADGDKYQCKDSFLWSSDKWVHIN